MLPDTIAFNPLLFEVQQEPYPYYARLRDVSPVCYIESLDAWGIFRYDDVMHTLKHPELFSARNFIANAFGEFDPVPEVPSIKRVKLLGYKNLIVREHLSHYTGGYDD